MSPQVVVVTGAGTGIGRAICLAFARRGATVVTVGRSPATLEESAEQIRAAGGEALVQPADVTDRSAIDTMIGKVRDRFGRVDVLVNNAAQVTCAPLDALGMDDFDAMLSANAAGVVYACKAVWPLMKAQGGGVIVNTSSLAALDPFPGLTAYGATKAFVNLWTKGLAEEGRPHGVRVFAVGPGAVETAMLRGEFPDFPADQALPPSAVADVIVNLAEPHMRHCTGQTVYVRK